MAKLFETKWLEVERGIIKGANNICIDGIRSLFEPDKEYCRFGAIKFAVYDRAMKTSKVVKVRGVYDTKTLGFIGIDVADFSDDWCYSWVCTESWIRAGSHIDLLAKECMKLQRIFAQLHKYSCEAINDYDTVYPDIVSAPIDLHVRIQHTLILA